MLNLKGKHNHMKKQIMILILLGNISLIYARVGLFPYQDQHLMGKRRIRIMKREHIGT
ncbi:MAG: hypothetical protein PUF83_10970 [Intestinibaculum porci]|uniref:hypothetical protein n=1 Tax=Intestinibaculum porci TaxID=2487118 RepID=UPI0024097B2B|nr:hypothetical protein [Intestinibaculum porci]MDD6423556.1 hypothetical protein [Intestinibaculum porci]